MKKLMFVFGFLIASLSPGFARTQIDAATWQDVEDLMQLTGARERIPLIDSAMAGQYMPEIETQIEKTAADAPQPALTPPK